MMKKLSPVFVEQTKTACWKAFWFKRSLRLFLRQHGIPDSTLSGLDNDKKINFLTRLFYSLVQQNEGYAIILNIARSLVEMTEFPDLANNENSQNMIQEASAAVTKLKEMVDKLNQQVRDERQSQEMRRLAAEERAATISAQQSLSKLSDALTKLLPHQGTAEGGRDFEKWFIELLTFFEIQHRKPYTDDDGRQIDGALTLDGTTYLIEAKFQNSPIGSQEIDIFNAKIKTKSDNTMGIMISMSGYNPNAVHTASQGRTFLLLMDYSHIFNLILTGRMTLPDVIRRIARHASQTGTSFLAADKFTS